MAVMQINVAFGKTGIALNLPDPFRYRVLEARTAKPLQDWQGALEHHAHEEEHDLVVH